MNVPFVLPVAARGRGGGGRDAIARLFTFAQTALAVFAFGTVVASAAAAAPSFAIKGASGYLSEWEFGGHVIAAPDGEAHSFVGPVTMKHVGLCSQSGPEEKAAELRVRINGAGMSSRMTGTIVINGAACTFSGPASGSFTGVMDCPDAKGVPMTFSMQ